MPKYWGKQIFTHGRFPEVGEKQKAEKKEKKEKKEVKTMTSFASSATTCGARKHVWTKIQKGVEECKDEQYMTKIIWTKTSSDQDQFGQK